MLPVHKTALPRSVSTPSGIILLVEEHDVPGLAINLDATNIAEGTHGALLEASSDSELDRSISIVVTPKIPVHPYTS